MANATNVLTQGIEIKGSIKFSNDMIIDGKVDGEIISEKGKFTEGVGAAPLGAEESLGIIWWMHLSLLSGSLPKSRFRMFSNKLRKWLQESANNMNGFY